MQFTYTTSPEVCSRSIDFEINDGRISAVKFNGGCNGSLKAVSLLVIGLTPEEAAAKISGVTCGNKSTSCPDQLAQALKKYIAESK